MSRHFTSLAAAACFCGLVAMILAAPAWGGILHVKADSPNNGPGGDWDHAYHTVTAAVLNANPADEIHIAQGTYHEHITLSKGISLLGGYSTNGEERSARVYTTTLTGSTNTDGSYDTGGSVITITSSASGSVTIDGLTIQKGKSTGDGGGINCLTSAAVTISGNIIQNCSTATTGNSYRHGGGLYFLNTSVTLSGNIIRNNTATAKATYYGYGGGVYCAGNTSSNVLMVNNQIDHNTATGWGGGIYCNAGQPNIVNNTIADNTAARTGGGVTLSDGSAILMNNIVAYNSSGLDQEGTTGSPSETYNIVYGNPVVDTSAKNYEGLLPANGGPGDQQADPSFKAHDNLNSANCDYHIVYMSVAPYVPYGVDQGHEGGCPYLPPTDLDGVIRPQDSDGNGTIFYDRGAYEFPMRLTTARNNYSDGSAITFGGQSVIGVFTNPSRVYVECPDTVGGMRVDTSQAYPIGTRLNVVGIIRTDSTGERYVAPNAGWPTVALGTFIPDPVDSTTNFLSGKKGMLARITGTITEIGPNYVYVDDGAGKVDGTTTNGVPNIGARVVCDPTGLNSGDSVTVVGVGTQLSDYILWAMLTRSSADITVTMHHYSSVAKLKQGALGAQCTVDGLVVIAGQGSNYLYVEDTSRANGIRVDASNSGFFEGDVVTVTGTPTIIASGELQLSSATVTKTGSQTPLLPLGMLGRSVGGVSFGQQTGAAGASGVSNIGLLITTWGSVTHSEAGFFYLDDGSNLDDGSGYKGVKVYGTIPAAAGGNPVGAYLRVTGISICEQGSGNTIRAILTRSPGDVSVM